MQSGGSEFAGHNSPFSGIFRPKSWQPYEITVLPGLAALDGGGDGGRGEKKSPEGQ